MENAHFNFNMIASLNTIELANPKTWQNSRFYTYLLLKPTVNVSDFSRKMNHFYETHFEGDSGQRLRYTHRAQPLAEIYLHSNLQDEIGTRGSITRVYIFSVIGGIILLLACINYTNLATARSVARAGEVGIKKVIGVKKAALIGQYLSESLLLTLVSFLLASLLALVMQPFFQVVTGKELSLVDNPAILLFITGVSVLTGLLSGIYPAFILSSFRPIHVLKASFRHTGGGALLRKSLVIAQFSTTLVLVTGIVIVYSQMSFIGQKELGFNKDALFFIRVNGNTDIINGYHAFRNELDKTALIKGVALSNTLIGGFLAAEQSETVDGTGEPVQIATARIRADQNYLSVYDIRLVKGTNLLSATNNQSIIPILVNETMVKRLRWRNAEEAIGKPFKIDGVKGIVSGVVSDFHFNSLLHDMEPLIIYPVSDRFSRINIRIDGTRPLESAAFIERAWKKHFPSSFMDFGFLDEQLQSSYESEQRFSKILLVFSLLSLVIAGLGLYGLTAYSTFQKTREVGIRKVLGASVSGIALMLSKGFFRLVLFAIFLSIPVSWYLMNRWLENFAYHIHLSWWMFGLPALLVIAIAMLSVCSHVLRSALANPVKSMRME